MLCRRQLPEKSAQAWVALNGRKRLIHGGTIAFLFPTAQRVFQFLCSQITPPQPRPRLAPLPFPDPLKTAGNGAVQTHGVLHRSPKQMRLALCLTASPHLNHGSYAINLTIYVRLAQQRIRRLSLTRPFLLPQTLDVRPRTKISFSKRGERQARRLNTTEPAPAISRMLPKSHF